MERILNYLKENEEEFNQLIMDLNSWNGYLGENVYYDMEELNDFYCNTEPLEILRRAFYGYDEDTSTPDNHTEFNPNRNYFTFNVYGNLVSSDYIDYSAYCDKWFVVDMLNNLRHLSVSDELMELIEEVQNN